MCLYNKLVLNKKYTKNKKNGGIIPPITDHRTLYVPIKCGNCIECRKQYAREWQIRLLEDIKEHTNGKFITLTLSNESYKEIHKEIKNAKGYKLDNEIATYAVRHFLERWRKKYKKSLRHWFVTELGHQGTENIHLHGIIWTDEPLTTVEEKWAYGFMWKGKRIKGKMVNYVNNRTVSYITKYVHKIDQTHPYYKSKILTSPSIGSYYTKQLKGNWNKNKFNEENTNTTYTTQTGHKISLPIYWRNKIYNEQEREKLWLHNLNKMTRYVCGEKISISKGLNDYFKVREWYRKINNELGYRTDKIDYDEKEYEEQQRTLVQLTRIHNAKKKTYNNNNYKDIEPKEYKGPYGGPILYIET